LIDGNNRTAIAAAAIYLQINGFRLIATNQEVEIFVLSVARGEKEVPGIASWLEYHLETLEGGENGS
jgi:death-on-curing protein